MRVFVMISEYNNNKQTVKHCSNNLDALNLEPSTKVIIKNENLRIYFRSLSKKLYLISEYMNLSRRTSILYKLIHCFEDLSVYSK